MLDIEEKLDDEGYKNALLESLHLEIQQMKNAINGGLTPKDYTNYSKYVKTLESSLSTLNKYKKTTNVVNN